MSKSEVTVKEDLRCTSCGPLTIPMIFQDQPDRVAEAHLKLHANHVVEKIETGTIVTEHVVARWPRYLR